MTDIAKRYSISVNTVQRLCKIISYSDKPKLPKVLSIDEFKGNSDNVKFHCIILDPKNGNLLDIIKDRKEALHDKAIKRLDTIFWNSPKLANAYELKEMFFRVMDEENLKLKEKMLSQWISFSKNSNIKEFIYYASTFENWKDEIINSFYCPYTNGCIEGTNNLIKVVKRIAFGYRNFNNFRTRIMHIKHQAKS